MSRIEEAIRKMKAQSAAAAIRDDVAAVAPVREPRPLSPDARAAAEPVPFKRPTHTPPHAIEIDMASLREAHMLPAPADERKIENEFRSIKRALLGNVTGRSGRRLQSANIIMVASALPEEGKTFTTLNLAFSLALEKDFRLVLIDGDVAKPNISRALGLEQRRGLLDVLADETLRLEDVEVGTNVPGLSVVPAGRQQATAAELLSSARMEQLVAGLGAYTDCLYLFDTTPLLLTNESRVLAEMAGQVVLVVRAGVTPQGAVMDALAQIPEERYVGLVLNQRRGGGGSYYYGYDYGDYGRDGQETA